MTGLGSVTFILFGVSGAIRTRGLSLRRRTLYPAELRKHLHYLLILQDYRFLVNTRVILLLLTFIFNRDNIY